MAGGTGRNQYDAEGKALGTYGADRGNLQTGPVAHLCYAYPFDGPHSKARITAGGL